MLRFVLGRVATSILMLVATSAFVFIILRLLPGDPVITRLGESSTVSQEVIDQIRRELGLDLPFPLQYWQWLTNAVQGDFGRSFFSQYPVTDLIAGRIEPTVELAILALILTIAISLPVAIMSARRPGGLADRIVQGISSLAMSTPQFLLGLVLILIFGIGLDLLPTRGFTPIAEGLGENLSRMIMPSLTLALISAPILIRFLRASLVEALSSPYVRTAQGKGVPENRIITRHVLQNALIPSLTVVGMMVGGMLGGAVVIEYVFGISGLGSLAIEAVGKRDYAIVQAVTVFISGLFILTSLIVDLLYGVLDPRLRVKRSHG